MKARQFPAFAPWNLAAVAKNRTGTSSHDSSSIAACRAPRPSTKRSAFARLLTKMALLLGSPIWARGERDRARRNASWLA